MTGFFALLRLQLLSRYADLKPRNMRAQMKEKRGRVIGMTILILFLIIYLGGMLFFLETRILDILMKMGMPDLLVTMAVILATAGTLVMSFFFVLSVLYLGRDAAYLASLPIKPRTILSAKMTQVWLSETAIDAILLLPACILYAVRTGAGVGFYLRLIPTWLLISLLPICLIAFLSSLLIRLSALWKHREILLTVSGIVLLVGYMFLMMNLGGMTGDSGSGGEMLESFVKNNTQRIEAMSGMFPPAAWAAEGLLGQNTGMYLLWILISLAAPVVTVWLLGYSYRKLSMLQSETPGTGTKKRTGKESFATGSQLKACVMREIRTILRVPSYATNILPVSFMPVLIVLMMSFAFGRNMGENGEGFQAMLSKLPGPLVMGILAAVMGYVACINPAMATAVTREGKGHDFITALPVPSSTLIRAKLIVGFSLSALGVIAATIALIFIMPGLELSIILAGILCLLFCYVASLLALDRDIRKPRLDWVTEQEAVKQNFGVLISMLTSWGIMLALGVLTYFLITWKLDTVPIFLILAVLLAGLGVFIRMRLNKVAEKYYCAG